MTDGEGFAAERRASIERLGKNADLRRLGMRFIEESGPERYSYNFDWLGLPIIQYPGDIVAVQELIWRVRPQAVIETGVARGGSLALSASILSLLGGDRLTIGVDIEIRPPNRAAIAAHPLAPVIRLVEGSSVDAETLREVDRIVGRRRPFLVLLDSSHSHSHVLRELELYSPYVEAGSYVVVFDTSVEFMPPGYFPDRPWGPGNSPKTAVDEFLAQPGCRFEVDDEYESKLVISVAPGGYLRCVR